LSENSKNLKELMNKLKEQIISVTQDSKFKILYGPETLTRFEKSRIIGARALQLALSAPPLIDPGNEKDPIKIAKIELREDVLPLTIRRNLPSGDFQNIPIKILIENEQRINKELKKRG